MRKHFYSRSINELWQRRHDGAPVLVGTIPQEVTPKMESKSEQLAGKLVDGIKAFEAKVEQVMSGLDSQLRDGHEVLDATASHVEVMGAGINHIKNALARLTNGGPPLEK